MGSSDDCQGRLPSGALASEERPDEIRLLLASAEGHAIQPDGTCLGRFDAAAGSHRLI